MAKMSLKNQKSTFSFSILQPRHDKLLSGKIRAVIYFKASYIYNLHVVPIDKNNSLSCIR